MTPAALLAECERAEKACADAGLDPSGAMVLVTVRRASRPKNWQRCRVVPGVFGRCVGELQPNGRERIFVVDVRAVSLRAAIRRVAA